MNYQWKNVKMWLNAHFRVTELYDCYANSKWISKHGEDELPIEIEIETINRCNGTCSFCPVNANMPQRKKAIMSEVLFHKIIDELAALNYRGKISLYSNNEPLLDERIIAFHCYAREKLPEAYFSLYTNGTLLNVDKFKELIKYLNYFVIDNYNDNLQVNDNLKEVYDYLQRHKELNKALRA